MADVVVIVSDVATEEELPPQPTPPLVKKSPNEEGGANEGDAGEQTGC